MSPLDRIRIARILEAADLPANRILDTLDAAGITLTVQYEPVHTYIVGTEHEL